MKINTIAKFATSLILFAIITATAFGDEPVRHLKLVYETQPTGPNETFYVRLVLEEHDITVGSYQLRVGFLASQGHLMAIHDNLGVGGSGAGANLYLNTTETSFTGVSYADTYRLILLDTSGPIQPPVDPNADFNLGRLEFQTSPTYAPSQGAFGIYLTEDYVGAGITDGNIVPFPVEYISLDPTSAVADWAMY